MKAQHCIHLCLICFLGILSLFPKTAHPGSVSTAYYDQVHPRLAYNSSQNEYLAVWEDHRWGWGEARDIYAQRLDEQGVALGGNFGVSWDGAGLRQNPDVVYHPGTNQYLVALDHEESGYRTIQVRLVGHDASLPGSEIILSEPSNYASQPSLAVNPATSGYSIVWQERIGSDEFSQNDIHLQRLNSSGTPVGSTIVIANNTLDESSPAISCATNGACLVVWQEKQPASYDYDIKGQLVSSTGTFIGGRLTISGWEYDQLQPRLAFNTIAEEFLVVWEDHHWAYGAESDIYGQRISSAGAFIGSNFGISWDTSNHRIHPDIGFNSATNNYLVTWEYAYSVADHDIYFRLLQGDGSLGQSERTLSASTAFEGNPTAASSGALSFLSIWEDARDAASPDVGLNLYDKTIPLYLFSGHVYDGFFGDTDTPLSDTTVALYCSSNAGSPGSLVTDSVTDEDGWFGLAATDGCEFYSLLQTDLLGYTSQGAASDDGTVGNANFIQYPIPLAGKNLDDNFFWDKDITAPEILAGPVVQDITPDSAVILWLTTENTDGIVLFDRQAGPFNFSAGSSVMEQYHQIVLTGLAPSATYRFTVQSTDVGGNMVESEEAIFQTEALADSSPPVQTVTVPDVFKNTVSLDIEANDNTGVEKVEFFLDDQLLFTDYGPPYTFPLDTVSYANDEYTLKIKTTDLYGNISVDERLIEMLNVKDIEAPVVTITSPAVDWTSVSGKVLVTADLSDDTGLARAYFRVNGNWEAMDVFNDNPKQKTVTFEWDTTEFGNGNYTLAVEAYDIDTPYFKYGYATREAVVNQVPPPKPPKLKVDHSVTRYGNFFAVSLSITNVGDQAATGIEIQDYVRGFQPIDDEYTAPVHARFTSEYDPWKKESQVRIVSYEDIPAQQSRTYSYFVVPILFEENLPTPEIGFQTGLHYDKDPDGLRIHDWVNVPVPVVYGTGGKSVAESYNDAVKESDYLIVTNPVKLFSYGNTFTDEVYGLLSDMAELGRYRNGVLGFLDSFDREKFKDLIEANFFFSALLGQGEWAEQLKYKWSINGYLLLVGENNVVPAWSKYLGSHPVGSGQNYSWIADPTDYPYASTFGDEMEPELSIGRIVGNNPTELRTPLRTSINVAKGTTGYDFDRSDSLLVGGFPQGLNGGAMKIKFDVEVDRVLTQISNKPVVPSAQTIWQTPSYTQFYTNGLIDQAATTAEIRQQFFNDTADQDIVFLAGHGNAGSWDEISATSVLNESDPFSTSNPFVFGSSCQTGRYNAGTSMAEAFLRQEAGAYLGATISGACNTDNTCPFANTFFSHWELGESLGLALKRTKRAIRYPNMGYLSIQQKVWTGIYHLFGDPKYGALSTSSSAADSSRAMPEGEAEQLDADTPPAADVIISVPDYELTQVDGMDRVVIPGGNIVYQPGLPMVPSYTVTYDFPKEYRVQGVQMTGRSGLSTLSGLNLPATGVGIPGYDAPELLNEHVASQWWPERHFDWSVSEGPDTVTLSITVYPFVYNDPTGEAEFHHTYAFFIDYQLSSTQIIGLTTDQDEYNQGDEVHVDMYFQHTAPEPENLLVEAVIRPENEPEPVGGLRLENLDNVSGTASWSTTWDSNGYPTGYYEIEVLIKNEGGLLRDRRLHTFRLGTSQGDITAFNIDPTHFQPGDPVEVSVVFENSGSIPVSGNVVVLIYNESGEKAGELSSTFVDLLPGANQQLLQVWDSELDTGIYNFTATVLYDGKSAGPVTVSAAASTCPTDSDFDGDVDGLDLIPFVSETSSSLMELAAEFGNDGC